MKNFNSLLLSGALGVALTFSSIPVSAQPATAVRQPKTETNVLRISNVRASMIAFWIDPVNNTKPAILRTMTELDVVDSRTDEEIEEARVKFEARFPGLVSVTALDANNALFVTGTLEAIAKVSEEIKKLDKPLKLVEVEARVVQIDPKNLGQLGLSYLAPDADSVPPKAIAGIGTSEIVRAKLDDLTAAGKAKIVAAPRITLIDSIGGQMDVVSSLPATIGVRGADGEFRELKAQGEKSGALTVEMLSSLFVLPTIQDDDTVTLNLRPSRRLGLTDSQRAIPLKVLSDREITINAKDGDTVVVNGVTVGGSVADAIAGDKAQHTVMLVTSRIIRRVGD